MATKYTKKQAREAGRRALEDKLLTIGGRAVMRMPDPHMDILLRRGDGRRDAG